MTIRACQKPPAREKPPRKRMARVRKRFQGTSWAEVRRVVLERAGGRCVVCRQVASQAAHVHGLGNRHAGGRHDPDATCSVCGCRVNDPANLRAVCGSEHNAAVARPCPGRSAAGEE